MKETASNSPYTFLHEDGSIWFDLSDSVKKYEIYCIRDKWGGNDGIHKIINDEYKGKKGNNN